MITPSFLGGKKRNTQSAMPKDCQDWVKGLNLVPHPEGGYYKEMIRSDESLNLGASPERIRSLFTSIYFLLTSESPSHFHRLKSDEMWFYHAGSPLTVHLLHPNGTYEAIRLGLNIEAGEVLQAIVPKGVIFGSSVDENGDFSVVSCVVSPGFHFDDFELFTKKELLHIYPNYGAVINKLAYDELPVK